MASIEPNTTLTNSCPRTVSSRTGAQIPVLGQGTFRMGLNPLRRKQEIAALRCGLDLGLTLIDTAEMYASGNAEKVVAEAINGRRDEVFLVTKVLPGNATQRGARHACDASLKRLRTDHVDLFLLHWPSSHPLEETLEAFEMLRQEGKILHFGVSNFDIGDMELTSDVPNGNLVACNQVLYNLSRREPEWALMDWCRERHITFMAYTPLERMRLVGNSTLERVARRHRASSAQVAIAWTLRLPGVVTIPKAATVDHVRENAQAAELRLSDQDLAELDAAFPPPSEPQPIAFL